MVPNSQLEAQMIPLLRSNSSIESVIECSARTLMNISDLFSFAIKAVLYPRKPLIDLDTEVTIFL